MLLRYRFNATSRVRASSSRVARELERTYSRARVELHASSSEAPRELERYPSQLNIYCSRVKCHKLSLVPANPIHWIRHKVNVVHALVLKHLKACAVAR